MRRLDRRERGRNAEPTDVPARERAPGPLDLLALQRSTGNANVARVLARDTVTLPPVDIEGRVPRKPQESVIPIADFIRYVESVESVNPKESPADTLSRIRVQWYNGTAFDQLIPDAATTDTLRIIGPAGGSQTHLPKTLAGADPEAQKRLTSHASENAAGDNPSPYIRLDDGESVDAGHLFLAMDALNHPRTGAPYSVYGVENIDPAGWVADVGIAAVWTTIHEESGKPDSRAPVKLAGADFEAYYRMSAPEEDILGDTDAYAMKEQWDAGGGQKLSQVLRDLYLGGAGKKAGVSHRWRSFCKANGLVYREGGGKVTFDQAAVDRWVTRIDRFNDLYGAGGWGALGATLISPVTSPGKRPWPHTRRALLKFLDHVAIELGAELAEP